MKKLKLFALGLIGASMMMTSCTDDSDDPVVGPSLVVTETNSADGIVDGKVSIAPGDSLHFEWTARDGDAKLQTLIIEIDDVKAGGLVTDKGYSLDDNISSSNNETYQDGVWLPAGSIVTTKVYSFVLTDKDGESETVSVTVMVEPQTTPLSAAQAFTWERQGGAAGTGLAQFGLKWTSNSATSAIIADDAATLFVELSPLVWTSITTREELVNAINAATPITQYTGISVTQSDTYDVVLATMNGGDVYIMHVTDATVTTGGSGTNISINGMYKM